MEVARRVAGVAVVGVLEAKAALARGKARVDYGLWGLVRSTTTPDELEGLGAAGAIGFKAYLGYAFSLGHKQGQYSLQFGDPDLEAPPDYGRLARLAPDIPRPGLPPLNHAA